MEYESHLTQAIFLKRPKGHLVEVAVNKSDRRSLYCTHMGPMPGCEILGSRVWFSKSPLPCAKYPYTWELVEVDGGYLVHVNPCNCVSMVLEGIENGTIPELAGYDQGSSLNPSFPNSLQTCDLKLLGEQEAWVMVQPVTLGDEIQRGFYPSTPCASQISKLKALIREREKGARAVLFFCVKHTGIQRLVVADHIDPTYGHWLRVAQQKGVEILAYQSFISLNQVFISHPIPLVIPNKQRYLRSNTEKKK